MTSIDVHADRQARKEAEIPKEFPHKSASGPKWRQALIAAGHRQICHKCAAPIPAGLELKHLHEGKYYGERIDPVPWDGLSDVKRSSTGKSWTTGHPGGKD